VAGDGCRGFFGFGIGGVAKERYQNQQSCQQWHSKKGKGRSRRSDRQTAQVRLSNSRVACGSKLFAVGGGYLAELKGQKKWKGLNYW
jgi:hypothetical protein